MHKKVEINGYVLGVGRGTGGIEITDDEAEMLIDMFANQPVSDDGFSYRLRSDHLEWEKCELPIVEERAYTIEQLEAMSNVELREICSKLGIPTSMVKQNMISLILDKQNRNV